jgi:hypothetical protein
MPQIIVTTASDRGDGVVTLLERVTAADLESPHFAAQLLERLEWAVRDADAVDGAAATQLSASVVTTAS